MSFSKSDLNDSDALAETSLPEILIALHRARFDGALAIESRTQRRRFVFRKGSPVLAESNSSGDALGRQLASEGLLSERDYRPVLDYAAKKGVSEAAALLALQVLDPLQLLRVVREQVRKLLFDSLDWGEGRYEVIPGSEENTDMEPLRWDLPPLIHQGLMGHWGVDKLLETLSSKLQRYPRPRPGFAKAVERLELDTEHATLLRGLGGDLRMGEALGESLTSPSVLAAVWVLDALGSVDFTDESAETDEIDFEAEIEFDRAEDSTQAEPGEVSPPRRDPAPPQRSNALRAEVEELRASMESADHYELLGVRADAKPAAIRKAYLEAAKRYHPDALAHLGLQQIKREASEVFSRIAEAFEVLSDTAAREAYDAHQRGEFSDSDARRLAQAETTYRKGEVLLRMGDFRGALEYLAPAVEIWPEDGAYQSALGWALYKQAASDPKTAREHLARAIELAPRDAVAHFRLGMVLRALGHGRAAEDRLEQAKRLEPSAE